MEKEMWDAYAKQAGGVTFDGKPLPTWDELGEERQACWKAAASVCADEIKWLRKALQLIAAPSKIIAKGEDMAVALQVLLSSNRKIAIAALKEGE